MAVAYDNHARAEGNFVTSLGSGSFTISGANRVMVINVAARDVTINAPTSTAGTPAAVTGASASNTGRNAVQYRIIAPTTGSQSATANFPNADGTNLVCQPVTFTDADQTTPCQNGTSATGTSTDPTVTVPSTTADDMVVDCCHHGSISAAGANQIDRGTRTASFAGVSTQDGADGGVMSWTSGESLPWATVACRIVAAAGEPGPDLAAGPGEPTIYRSTF